MARDGRRARARSRCRAFLPRALSQQTAFRTRNLSMLLPEQQQQQTPNNDNHL
jgi:hypothetical protein